MGMRLISLPVGKGSVQDPDGFVTDSVDYVRNIRATSRSATAEEETVAAADGYTISRVYSTAGCNYGGQSFLIDQNEDRTYDIRRTADSGRMVCLYAEARKNGKVHDAARNG